MSKTTINSFSLHCKACGPGSKVQIKVYHVGFLTFICKDCEQEETLRASENQD